MPGQQLFVLMVKHCSSSSGLILPQLCGRVAFSHWPTFLLSFFFLGPSESIQTDYGPERTWENNPELIIQKVPAKFYI